MLFCFFCINYWVFSYYYRLYLVFYFISRSNSFSTKIRSSLPLFCSIAVAINYRTLLVHLSSIVLMKCPVQLLTPSCCLIYLLHFLSLLVSQIMCFNLDRLLLLLQNQFLVLKVQIFLLYSVASFKNYKLNWFLLLFYIIYFVLTFWWLLWSKVLNSSINCTLIVLDSFCYSNLLHCKYVC